MFQIIFEAVAGWTLGAGCDWGKEKIKNALEGKFPVGSHVSNETKFYQAIINALNSVSYNRYQGKDIIYQAAENLVIDWRKKEHLDLDVPREGLQYLLDKVSRCDIELFIQSLYDEITKDEELRNRFIVQKTVEIQIKLEDVYKQGEELKDDIHDLSRRTIAFQESMDLKNPFYDVEVSSQFTSNLKQVYIDKWNDRLFLHRKDNDKLLMLSNTFIIPDYSILYDRLFEKNGIDKFIRKVDTRTGEYKINAGLKLAINNVLNGPFKKVLISGDPGIGKSSIIAWIAHNNCKNENLIILRFKDWEIEDLENGLLKCVTDLLNCKKKELNDKILILDGFDEIKSISNRNILISDFLEEVHDLNNIKIIITSRPNYIISNFFELVICIKSFDEKRIKDFHQNITGFELKLDKPIENKNILGIPVILYMAIVSGINLNNSNYSKPELYRKIFSIDGGIFDRFSIGMNDGYDHGKHVMLSMNNKKEFLNFLQLIAFKMFDHNILILEKGSIDIPKMKFENKKVEILDFPIKNLFEEDNNLEFVHKSLFDYFVAKYIFIEINDKYKKSKEALYQHLVDLLTKKVIDAEILEFLSFEIITGMETKDRSYFVDIFSKILTQSCTNYYQNRNKDFFELEAIFFQNTINFLKLWDRTGRTKVTFYSEIISKYLHLFITRKWMLDLSNADFDNMNLENYICVNIDFTGSSFNNAYLQNVFFRKVILNKVGLVNCNLSNSCLIDINICEADLRGADLKNTDLSGCDLLRADLRKANLKGAKLKNTNLRYADFRGANISNTDFRGANMENALFDTEIENYIKHNFPGLNL